MTLSFILNSEVVRWLKEQHNIYFNMHWSKREYRKKRLFIRFVIALLRICWKVEQIFVIFKFFFDIQISKLLKYILRLLRIICNTFKVLYNPIVTLSVLKLYMLTLPLIPYFCLISVSAVLMSFTHLVFGKIAQDFFVSLFTRKTP
jgi:hypothetical protein